jgi:hypothetical protein
MFTASVRIGLALLCAQSPNSVKFSVDSGNVFVMKSHDKIRLRPGHWICERERRCHSGTFWERIRHNGIGVVGFVGEAVSTGVKGDIMHSVGK